MVHPGTEGIGIRSIVVIDQRRRPGLGSAVADPRLALHPGIQNGEIFPDNPAVSLQNYIAVLKGYRRQRFVEQPAADMVIIPMGQERFAKGFVMGCDPAEAQPRQRKDLRHAADRDASSWVR